ncbi:GHKL domain-containing protein, partial [Enterococcus cecorum]
SQKSFKSIFHDFKNSVILIDKYVRNGEKNKATEYLKQIQNEISYIQGNQLHIYTSHEDLNYLLIAKKFYANSQNISVKIDCFLTDDTLISNDVIIVILGNLIDNAINACLADHYTIYKYIHLKIKQTDSNLNIIITNSVSPDVTKETLHEGTGIKNIKKIVNRNEGFYCRTLDYDVYTVKIILWGTNGNISNI